MHATAQEKSGTAGESLSFFLPFPFSLFPFFPFSLLPFFPLSFFPFSSFPLFLPPAPIFHFTSCPGSVWLGGATSIRVIPMPNPRSQPDRTTHVEHKCRAAVPSSVQHAAACHSRRACISPPGLLSSPALALPSELYFASLLLSRFNTTTTTIAHRDPNFLSQSSISRPQHTISLLSSFYQPAVPPTAQRSTHCTARIA